MGNVLNLARPNPANIAMASKFVNEAITKEKVVIFSKSHCPYCTMAKEEFRKINQAFTAIEIEKRDDCSEIQAALGEITGATTVPRVFINGKFIGGGTDIKRLNQNGQLKELLA